VRAGRQHSQLVKFWVDTMLKWFWNLAVIFKIGILAGVLLTLLLSVGGVAIYFTQQIAVEIEEISEADIPLSNILTNLEVTHLQRTNIYDRVAALSENVLATGGSGSTEVMAEFEELTTMFAHHSTMMSEQVTKAEEIITEMLANSNSVETTGNFEEFSAGLQKFQELSVAYFEQSQMTFQMFEQRQFSRITAMIEPVEAQEKVLNEKIVALADYIKSQTAASAASAESLEQAMMLTIIVVLSIATALGVGMTILVGGGISSALKSMTGAMKQLADGDLETDIPARDRTDEIGHMAGAVQVFKDNAIKIAAMTEEEVAATQTRIKERAKMMEELKLAFGDVVGAASAGDFSKRVDAEFPDDALNDLASEVNGLVEIVDRGLAETGVVLGALAQTDLSQRVEGEFEGAFGKLKDDTNAVAEKLGEIVGQLRDTSGALKLATGEILTGANDLSERTTKQAATVEETSATMEQLSSTVMESATKADDASSKSKDLAQTAEETGGVVNKATEAMERITTSSAKISNVIGMIDDIAFQTNLLALNASVEAARAGEAGKGFAVVAVEVRRLAQSAAEASTEVKQLVEQSASEVETGSKFVTSAAEKLQNMIGGIQANSSLMEGIATSSREQASSIEEVNAAVRQMDEMTQHNAALVEETNAAIEQTDNQVNELDRIVDVFKLGGSNEKPSHAPKADIKGLQRKAQAAAKTYLSEGNAAVDSEWSEF